MTGGLQIGVVKPDWGVSGGFERLLDRLLDHLRSQGHRIVMAEVDARTGVRDVWGVPVESHQWARHPELFQYLSLTESVRNLGLDRHDVVLATQPPSFLAPHHRTVALFYHQARVFYDLAAPWLAAGFGDPDLHREAMDAVHTVDRAHLGGVVHWLAGSADCRDRLAEHWGITDGDRTRVTQFHAGPDLRGWPAPPAYRPGGPVVCVSRHEWPKRTELVVAAAHLVPEVEVQILGDGGRLPVLRSLDAGFASGALDPAAVGPEDLWANPGHVDPSFQPVEGPGRRGLSIPGHVSSRQRDKAYGAAGVVVAPAYREDYGLTAIEAMAWGRPIIVCNDGGGLVELVDGTGAGLVVEPTAEALAAGIRSVRADRDRASEMGVRAREVAATYTWDRCFSELDAAVARASTA